MYTLLLIVQRPKYILQSYSFNRLNARLSISTLCTVGSQNDADSTRHRALITST